MPTFESIDSRHSACNRCTPIRLHVTPFRSLPRVGAAQSIADISPSHFVARRSSDERVNPSNDAGNAMVLRTEPPDVTPSDRASVAAHRKPIRFACDIVVSDIDRLTDLNASGEDRRCSGRLTVGLSVTGRPPFPFRPPNVGVESHPSAFERDRDIAYSRSPQLILWAALKIRLAVHRRIRVFYVRQRTDKTADERND